MFGNESDTTNNDNFNEKIKLFGEKLDDEGNYLVHNYKINFSPDMIYANATVSTYYGLLGTTVLSFSDMLGNHRLVGITGLQIDLKNSDYGLAYFYLPKRINYGFEFFHTARFLYLSGFEGTELYRFRNLSGAISASFSYESITVPYHGIRYCKSPMNRGNPPAAVVSQGLYQHSVYNLFLLHHHTAANINTLPGHHVRFI